MSTAMNTALAFPSGLKRLVALSVLLFSCALFEPSAQATASCCDVAGDADNSGAINIGDVVKLIDYIFLSGPEPACVAKADADGSGGLNIGDVVKIIDYVFLHGAAPVCPSGGDSTLSFAERSAAFSAIDSAMTSLDGVSPESLATVMLVFMSGLTQFAEVGREGNGLWGRFTDGRVALVPNNRFPSLSPTSEDIEPTVFPDSTIPAGFVMPQRLRPNTKKDTLAPTLPTTPIPTNFEIPESLEAFVINTLGAPCFTSATPKVKTMLANAGYSVNTTGGTVPELLNEIKDAGVFYIDAHGGMGKQINGNPSLGAIWTSTLYSAAGDSVFGILLNTEPTAVQPELVYMCAKDLYTDGTCRSHWRYAFTGEFVKQWMTFSKNSVAIINTCLLAGGSNNHGFFVRYGFEQAGVSLYGGWSKTVTDAASDKAGEHIIDRMLGANASTLTPVESPKQRPFDITLVKADMTQWGYDKDPSNGSELLFEQTQGGCQLLAPSIRYLYVQEHTDSMIITGYFGSDPANYAQPAGRRVKVNGTEIPIISWTPTLIICAIPDTGAGSVGPVVVEADGYADLVPLVQRKSNTVNLTEWRGPFTYTMTNSSTLESELKLNFHFRADFHSFRDKPHETPKAISYYPFWTINDAYGKLTASGQHTNVLSIDPYETETWTWDANDSIAFSETFGDEGFLFQANSYPQTKSMTLLLVSTALLTEHYSSTQGANYTVDLPVTMPFEMYDTPLYFNLAFDNSWALVAGQRNAVTCCLYDDSGGDITHNLVWPSFPAVWPPDPNAAQ